MKPEVFKPDILKPDVLWVYLIYIRRQDYSIFNPVPPAFITHFSHWGNSFRAPYAVTEILNKFVGTLGKCILTLKIKTFIF
jgi:hypothetical protein